MTEPGWYADYEDSSQLRYHDGTDWTEHVHASQLAAVEPTAFEPAAIDNRAEPASVDSSDAVQDPLWVKMISFPLLGLFGGLMFGGLFFNALGAITPVTESAGTVERITIEYDRSAGQQTRESYVLFGSIADGEDWRISDEDAYNTLQSEGYPQPVTVAIGDWTGTAERVTGASFDVNHQSTGGRVGWGVMMALATLIVAGISALIGRSKSGGAVPAVIFAVFLLGPGSWLGFQAFQWFQSG